MFPFYQAAVVIRSVHIIKNQGILKVNGMDAVSSSIVSQQLPCALIAGEPFKGRETTGIE
jgi:hypothetical protein